MIKRAIKKAFMLEETNEEIKLVSLFRYISLILTSLFYIIGDQKIPLRNKFIVVICMSVASYVLNYLYINNRSSKSIIKLIIIMEVLGNIMVLVPTGGISSPYFLYSLNTILIIVYYFNVFYSFLNIIIYIALSLGVTFLFLNKQYSGVVNTLMNNSNVILNYLLISVVSQQLLMLSKKLTAQSIKISAVNKQLLEANDIINNSMKHIISLYQTAYSFKNITNSENLIKLLVQYTREIANTSSAFYFTYSEDGEEKIEINGDSDDITKGKLVINLCREWENIINTEMPVKICMGREEYLVMIIKSSKVMYGALGIDISNMQNKILYMENFNQLKFLASLSVLTFERLELEEINERLLIAAEQKRIGDELHDITSQRLFGASCMINTLIYKSGEIEAENMNSQLKLVRDILSKAISELRNTIYNLSKKETGKSAFQSELINFTEDIAKLNNIKVSLCLTGNEDLLNSSQKKIIFRIICEGTGNSIRHGKCSNIFINLNIQNDYIKLLLKDDGIGFDVKNKISNGDTGLGLKNISNSVYLMNGNINISSLQGKGTTVDILLPNMIALNLEKKAE